MALMGGAAAAAAAAAAASVAAATASVAGAGFPAGGAPARARLHLAPRDAGALHAHAQAVQAGRVAPGGWAALRELSAPRAGAEARAEEWAGALGGCVLSASPLGDFLDVELPREAAEALGAPGPGLAHLLPPALAGDVLSARWVPGEKDGGSRIGSPPGGAWRALLQDGEGGDGGGGGDDDYGSSGRDSSGLGVGLSALFLMGPRGAFPSAYLDRTLSVAEQLTDLDHGTTPAIVVPCGVGVDPLTEGLTLKYHGSSGGECDFQATASFRVWYGGAFEPSEERSVALEKPRRVRCGDLLGAGETEAEAEQFCRILGEGVTLGLSLVYPSVAIVAEITADTSVFAFPLVENGLPTFVGISDPTLAVRIPDFDASAVLGGSSNGGGDGGGGAEDPLAEALSALACPGGGSTAACLTVNFTETDPSDLTDGFLGHADGVFPFFRWPALLGATVTPEYAKAAYGGANGTASGVGMSGLGAILQNYFNQTALFEATAAFELPTPEVTIYPGSNGPGNYFEAAGYFGWNGNTVESDLDVQMMAEYGPGASLGFLPTNPARAPAGADQSPDPCWSIENYIHILQKNQEATPPKPLPKFINISAGSPEISGITTSYNGNNTLCEESLAKLTAMGVLVIVASGDNGATEGTVEGVQEGVGPGGHCNTIVDTTADPTWFNTYSKYVVGTSFASVSWPATSPYVTAVGATMDVRMSEGEEPVLAAAMAQAGGKITSGGGFSSIYTRPEWQDSAVAGYFDTNPSNFKYFPGKSTAGQAAFTPSGRGIPDVSLYGYNIPIITGGRVSSSGGTSASSPMFGGLLLQLHARLEESGVCGSRAITFVQLNRFLYKAEATHPSAFIDVVHGQNSFYGQLDYPGTVNCGLGYPAAKGWDPVTGLGMINMPDFVEAAVEMADEFFCTS